MIQVYVYNSSRDGAFLHFWLLDTFDSSGPVTMIICGHADMTRWARQLLIRNAKAREDGQQLLLPERSTSWVPFPTESNDTTTRTQEQIASKTHSRSQNCCSRESGGIQVLENCFDASMVCLVDRNFRSWVFLKWGPNKNPPWKISLPLLGIGMPPCLLGHP